MSCILSCATKAFKKYCAYLVDTENKSNNIIMKSYIYLNLFSNILHYTPNGYIMPAEFDVHFLPHIKMFQNRTALHLIEIGLTNKEFCKRQIRLRQPPMSWKMCYFSTFCNAGVRVNVTDKL